MCINIIKYMILDYKLSILNYIIQINVYYCLLLTNKYCLLLKILLLYLSTAGKMVLTKYKFRPFCKVFYIIKFKTSQRKYK